MSGYVSKDENGPQDLFHVPKYWQRPCWNVKVICQVMLVRMKMAHKTCFMYLNIDSDLTGMSRSYVMLC